MTSVDWKSIAKKLGRRVDSIAKIVDELVDADAEASNVCDYLWEILGQLMLAERLAKIEAGIEQQNPLKDMTRITLTIMRSERGSLFVDTLSARHDKGLNWSILHDFEEKGEQLDIDVARAISVAIQNFLGVRM